MDHDVPNVSASLVLVSKDAGIDGHPDVEQFDPKLIPLDHTTLTIHTQENDESKKFATISWDAERKVWCVSAENAPPMVRINSHAVEIEPFVLRPNDVIKFENSAVKCLSYRFHSPPVRKEPELVNGEAMVNFSAFSLASRKRPRSRSSATETRVKMKCIEPASATSSSTSSLNSSSSVREHNGDKPEQEASQLEELRRELTCAVCKDLLYKTMTLECGHSFCKDCIDEWLARSLTCPMCREVTAKPPFASIVSDKSVEVLTKRDASLKEVFKTKKEQSEARLKKSMETQKKLNKVIMYAKKSGHKLVSIGNPWSKREQLRFFSGAREHYGPAREAYCACVSLTYDFIQGASPAELLVAIENLSLKPVDYKKDGEVDVMTAWSKMRTEDLRTRLVMFVKWS